MTKRIRTRVLGTAALTAAGLVATVGGVSYAAGGQGSTPAATAAGPHRAGHHHRAELLGRGEYGQVVVRRHGTDVTLDMQRGTLTALDVSGSTGSITVRSPDGHTQTFQLATTSRIGPRRSPVAPGSLTAGEHVRVLAEVSGSTATVTRMAVRPAAAAPAATGSAAPSASPGV